MKNLTQCQANCKESENATGNNNNTNNVPQGQVRLVPAAATLGNGK